MSDLTPKRGRFGSWLCVLVALIVAMTYEYGKQIGVKIEAELAVMGSFKNVLVCEFSENVQNSITVFQSSYVSVTQDIEGCTHTRFDSWMNIEDGRWFGHLPVNRFKRLILG